MVKQALFLLFLWPIFSVAQILTPVKWTSEVKDLGDGQYEILANAKIDKDWHMYSQQHPATGIGVPATVTFDANSNVELVGKTKEIGKLIDRYSEMFQQDEKLYENKVSFSQKIKLKNPKDTPIKFNIEFQVCDHEKCLAPDIKEFTVNVKPKLDTKKEEENALSKDEDTVKNDVAATSIDTANSTPQIVENIAKDTTTSQLTTAPNPETEDANKTDKEGKGLWGIFLLGVSGGLLALVMPCIFPMIPLTVSLFTKQSQDRGQGIMKALIYGISIVLIFVVLAVLATFLFGASALNEFSTNPWVNIAFFAIFIFFAISFFGAFEIALPASWANYTDKQADKGGYIGIFFMAFTLVIISFSCTLPIIGSLATQASMTGNYYALIVGSLGFSLTLAIPFVLFAIFPSWINSLPKSGGWMNTVKVSLGFIELAFAFKFLSNADLVWQAHFLEREVFLAIWIGIFGVMGIYLLGKFRLELDSPEDRIGVPRMFFAILIFGFVMYMIPGMWGAPVKFLSGLTPPVQYAESPNGLGGGQIISGGTESGGLVKGQHMGPHNIPAFLDLDEAIAYSNTVNKPVMIDFTGHACANCRKVEERVWSDPKVKESLMNDVVLVSLYVDERTELPKEQQIFSETLGRELKTVGNKWTVYQIEKYQNNAQPYYVIIDQNRKNYNEPIGALYDVNEYLAWMKKGIDGYKNK